MLKEQCWSWRPGKSVPNLYSNFAYNIDILMFESNDFLNCYLPQYFRHVLAERSTNTSSPQTPLTPLKTFIQLIKMAHQLFSAISQKSSFKSFLRREFSFLESGNGRGDSQSAGEQKVEMSKTEEILRSQIDQISVEVIMFFLKLMDTNLSVVDMKISKEAKSFHEKELLQLSNKIRLNLEISKIVGGNCFDFDEVMEIIFKQLEFLEICSEMKEILAAILTHEDSNISPQMKKYVRKNIQSALSSENCISNKENQPVNSTVKKDFSRNINELLRKTKKKTFNNRQAKDQNKFMTKTKEDRCEKSQIQPSESRERELPSPAKRIHQVVQNRKFKPIEKKRTIYFERKNLYHPKARESFFEKAPQFLLSETSIGSSERLTETKYSKHDESMMEDDEDSILVHSTPKVCRKIQVKAVSHRLQF